MDLESRQEEHDYLWRRPRLAKDFELALWQLREQCHKASVNSSTLTPACSKIPLSVPRLISRCIGTTQPRFPRRKTAWLPLCRLKTNPNRSNARRASFPETSGSLGMRQRRQFKSRKNRPASGRSRKFGKIKLRRLFQIGQGLLESPALGGRARLWIMGHQPIAIPVRIDDRREIL